jgi:hypothetical protein
VQAAGPSSNSASWAQPAAWHVPLLLATGFAFCLRYNEIGLNLMDEGWALAAGRALHGGATMYDDLFWVFPPGHALAAWIGWAIDPPGHMVARWIYSGFELGLVAAMYFLARRLMPAGWALLGGLMLVASAPDSHYAQFLFGYRYLLWTALALLCFARRLETGARGWLFVAGVLVAIAACFRTTPAFAAGCAIGFGTIFSTRDWREWLRDWTWFGSGILAVLVPVLVYFAAGVGLGAVWENVFVRAVVMTAKQAKPIPDIVLPDTLAHRDPIKLWFSAFQFRLHPAVYATYAVALIALWVRALRARSRYEHALLFAVVIWGALFFLRSLGRSDWGHLESALPPMCLLLAHALSLAVRAVPARPRPVVAATAGAVLLGAWVFVQGSDLAFALRPGLASARRTDSHVEISARTAQRLDALVRAIRKSTAPDETFLDLSTSPGLHAFADRGGPGYRDLVMPGTFLDVEDEKAFIRRLEADPPRVVVWPSKPFDRTRQRGIVTTAPHIWAWVLARYQTRGRDDGRWVLMVRLQDADRTQRFNRGRP